MENALNYLRIPKIYADWLGDLRWSANGEAVESADGDTFTLRIQLALFLQGFASSRRPIHFGFILHLLYLLGLGKLRRPGEFETLEQAFCAAGRPLWNAGVLCSELCRPIPPAVDATTGAEICRRLAVGPLMSGLCLEWARERPAAVSELPPLAPRQFEEVLARELRKYTVQELRHWLRHGRGVVKEAGEQIARVIIEEKPRTLAGTLASLTKRPRLAGTVPFVAQLVSALSLPPRRLAPQELPLGGYSDVTTRGQPELILPSQFALDDWDFIRRYAENELLFFRKEEPHTHVREDLVVVLDQGVRTWGDVRLVLSAAVLAFGKMADRRKIPFLVAATSSEGQLVDPLQVEEKEFGELLEASDLTPHPGLALERVLEERVTNARDIVLLTAPRNLVEADVAAAARRVLPGTRLFALAVAPQGNVQLVEVRRGIPVQLCRFHVDMDKARQSPKEEAPAKREEATPLEPWQGNIEPIGFPFRFGVVGKIEDRGFAFDQAGEWLLTASNNGMLHAWSLDGVHMEVLPRGWVEGTVLNHVEAVLGVTGGFVVGGRIHEKMVAIHYDFVSRTVTAHVLGPASKVRWLWFYFAELHSVACRDGSQPLPDANIAHFQEVTLGYAVDLATGGRYPQTGSAQELIARAQHAWARAIGRTLPSPQVQIVTVSAHRGKEPNVLLDSTTGTLVLYGTDMTWRRFTPLADGVPVLKDCELQEAQCCGTTLAVSSCRKLSADRVLRLFRGPEGIPLSEFPQQTANMGFALSIDGRYLARHVGRCQVSVRDVNSSGPPALITHKGGCHQELKVELGHRWLTIQVGNFGHLLRWDAEQLELRNARGTNIAHLKESLSGQIRGKPLPVVGVTATRNTPMYWGDEKYDQKRFLSSAVASVSVMIDVFGQLSFFDHVGDLVCMAFVFRGQIALWLPDGTRFGPPTLTGGPATPDALKKIGQALRVASEKSS